MGQRGLAGAVRSEECMNLSWLDRQVEPVENRMAIDLKSEVVNVE